MQPQYTPTDIPEGLCQCGCGRQTSKAHSTDTKRGYVKGHYRRYLPGHNPVSRLSLEESFRKRVTRGEPDECWPWNSTTLVKNGYGCLQVMYKNYYAHRLAWELHNQQPVPDGMHVCHSCDNPKCCNPAHLFLGTNQDNISDKLAKDRQPKGENQHNSKLTAPAVIEMRRMADTGMTYLAIAKHFGVSLSVAWEAINRVTWAHVS